MKSELREGDAEFSAPAARTTAHCDVPHRVPPVVFVAVVEPIRVLFDAGGIDGEFEGASPIVKRIDHDSDPVGGRGFVAPRPDANQTRRLGIDGQYRDIKCRRVVGNARFGVVGCRRAVVGLALFEAVDDGSRLPHFFRQLTVETDGRGGGQRRCGNARVTARLGLRFRKGQRYRHKYSCQHRFEGLDGSWRPRVGSHTRSSAARERLRPERGAKSPSESERGWPASTGSCAGRLETGNWKLETGN